MPSPVVAVLPCVGQGAHDYAVTQAEVDGWTPAYPGVDVKAEVLKARAWLDANPTKRKTQSGVPRFLVSWLGRAQDDARSPPRNGKPVAIHREAWEGDSPTGPGSAAWPEPTPEQRAEWDRQARSDLEGKRTATGSTP